MTGISFEEVFEKFNFSLQIRDPTRQAASGDVEKSHWRRDVDSAL